MRLRVTIAARGSNDAVPPILGCRPYEFRSETVITDFLVIIGA